MSYDSLLLSISALQHYSYCPRQCALIHQEQVFSENVHTLRGQAVHSVVDDPKGKTEKDIRVEYALPIYSDALGLIGKADAVEFHDLVPYPVEYKHGSRRQKIHDDLQLAAQAMCLEEMLGVSVPEGAVYYYRSRRRRIVVIDAALREHTKKVIESVRDLLQSEQLPAPVNDARCRECSLREICQPEISVWQKKSQNILQTIYCGDEK
jgi:CRISPR-associated exonuclease Cas4